MDAEKYGIDTLKKIKSDVDKIYKEVYHTPMLGEVYFSNPNEIKQNIQNVLNDLDELDKYLDEHTARITSMVNLKYNYTDLVKISTEITSYPTEERINRKKSILNVLSTARDLLKLARKDEDIKNLTIEVELFNKYLKLISRELGIAWRLLSTPEKLSRLILPTSGK